MNEATIMRQLQHKYIIQYFGVKQKKTKLVISMEYMAGGSLSAKMRASGPLELAISQKYTYQLLRALVYLHDHRIAHR